MTGLAVQPVGSTDVALIEKHQLAGIDDRQRGFNRPVAVEHRDHIYRATLQYERTVLSGESPESKEAAVHSLVLTLHERGYRQLKSQVSFRGLDYLGNQEPWIEYPDPEIVEDRSTIMRTVIGRMIRFFGRSGQKS